ncbi:MAG: hypothetical protein D6748_07050, partial [Calditrichaeota bacterium]
MKWLLLAILCVVPWVQLFSADGKEWVQGELILQVTQETAARLDIKHGSSSVTTAIPSIDGLLWKFQVYEFSPLYYSPPRNKKLDDSLGLSRTYLLKFPSSMDVIELTNALARLPEIVYAEPNRIMHITSSPNDSLFPLQWALENSGQAIAFDGSRVGVRDSDIDMAEAWEVSTGSSSVILSIIDSGIDYTHPEFSGRIIPGFDFVNNDSDPMDDNGHGTSCAGIAAASGNNGIGIAGINWNCQIMPVKVFDAAGGGTNAWVANGFIYAVDNGATVLSFSGGGGHSITLQNAIDYADAQDAVLIAARGNNNTITPFYPASYNNVIAVAALSPCNERKSGISCDGEYWWGSSYGADLDLIAPGVRIHTTDIVGPGGFATGDYYDTFNGTSAATPHVAGVASLIRTLNPNLTNSQVRAILQQSTVDIGAPGFDYETGYGRLNAFKALVITKGIPFAVAPDSLTFNQVGVGDTLQLFFKIFNNDTLTRNITLSSDNTAFIPQSTSLVIPGGELQEVGVSFIPSVTGWVTATLTVNAGDTITYLHLEGQGIDVPDIAVSPSSFNFILQSGDSSSSILTLSNLGTANLNWDITGISGRPRSPTHYPKAFYSLLPKGEDDFRKGEPITMNLGGPDNYGYIWRDSDEPGGPVFNWVDIQNGGTLVSGLADDNYVGPFPIGFTFRYYGQDYTEFYIGSNGFIGFGPPNSYHQYNNIPIPSTSDPDNILAWCWDDFRPINGSVYYQNSGNQLIVQFVNYEDFAGNGQINAQVILDANGTIRFQYLSLQGTFDGTSSTIGIENADGSDGLQVSFNAAYLHDSLTVEFSRSQWLTVQPATG